MRWLLSHPRSATSQLMTYRELMAEVAKGVTLEFPAQHPQVEGDIRRNVFGGAANREDPFIKITAVSGKTVTLGGGAAQKMKVGTPVAIYAADARRLAGEEKKLAIAKVTNVSALSSTAQLLDAATVPANAKVVLISRTTVAPRFGWRSILPEWVIRRGASSPPLRSELKTSKTIKVADR